MSNTYSYVFWLNDHIGVWYAIPRDHYADFFSGREEKITGLIKSKSIDTLIYLVDNPELRPKDLSEKDNNEI